MSAGLLAALAGALLLAVVAGALLAMAARRPPKRARIVALRNSTTVNAASGAVRSTQAADLQLAEEELEEIWSPEHLERLARTYWRFLSRVTLGLIHVHYSDSERSVVLLAPALRLLTFHAPEYEMDAARGVVRWRIARGMLVSRAGRGRGYLQIEISRSGGGPGGRACLHVEVEVANFYPAIATAVSRRVYNATQSRIHVVVTYAFLRSLARLDLAHSRVGRLAARR